MIRARTKLKLSCSSHSCGDDLHCFRESSKFGGQHPKGVCQACGTDCVDWERVHLRSEEDLEHTIRMLRHEFIRNYFWSINRLNDQSLRYALRKGIRGLGERSSGHLKTSIGAAHPFHDGWQTPIEESKIKNPFQYAQHATATCCRTCLEYWHGIPKGNPLVGDELDYLSKLVMAYVQQKIPRLPVVGLSNKEVNAFDLNQLYDND